MTYGWRCRRCAGYGSLKLEAPCIRCGGSGHEPEYEDDNRKDCPWKCRLDDPKCLCLNGESKKG